MNYIENLLQGQKVEWKTLGEVAKILNGYAFKSSNYVDEGVRVIRISDVQKGKISDDDLKFYPFEKEDELKKYLLLENDLVVSLTGYVGRVAMMLKKNLPSALNQRVACIRVNTQIDVRYLFHYLNRNKFEIEANNNAAGGGQKNLSTKWLSEYKLPIPPLSVQKEIANILDKFTTLEAELEAELDCRKRQYHHYRDTLLTFGDNVEWKTLGEIGEFIRGTGLQKKDFTETGVPAIHYGQIYTKYGNSVTETISFVSEELAKKLRKASKNDLVIAGVSENVEDVCKCLVWKGNEDVCVSGDTFIFKHNQNADYIGHLLRTNDFFNYKKKYAIGAKVTRLQAGKLKEYKIPLPPLEEQKRIVNILDKFDTLTNSITEGLPKEIELRRKQYEYYREKLLSFNKD